jgi:hypothetical protein
VLIRSKCLVVVLAGLVAASICTASTSRADSGQENCIQLSTSAMKCESPGNAEIDDSLSRANVSPQWSAQGGQSGGPYGGSFGGGAR